jgi:hypothetical protein
MGQPDLSSESFAVGRELIEELLRTAFALHDVLASLLDELPDDAFPGEDGGAVLLEMVVGTCLPAVTAAGITECTTATALIGAVRDRVLDDLRHAAELARSES